MLNIAEALKTIYKNDAFPHVSSLSTKDLEAHFPDLSLTVDTDQFASDKGDLELTESICTEDQVKFGKCNASQVKFTVANVTDSIKGKEFELNQIVNGTYTVPLGIFNVYTCPKQDDMIFKDITAYDRMKKVEIDVSAWYNGLFTAGTETYTLADFRASFIAYVGLEEDTTNLPLPNDSMIVEHTLDNPTNLSGRTVIEAIEEINGCFGHINRYGKFTHIILQPSYGLYPSLVLYPMTSLYPVSESDTSYENPALVQDSIAVYESVKLEEYSVKEIDKLIIRQEENDVGATIGTGTNAYIIQGNFLVYGKSASDLETIGTNAFSNINKRPYRPYESVSIGLPYIEVGDAVRFETDAPVNGYVFKRTLKGSQALIDEYEAKGQEEQTQSYGMTYEITQLKGKTAKIVRSVDELSATVEDVEQELSGQIAVLAGQVVLKVDSAGNIGYVQLDADPDTDLTSIEIKANNINLNGYVGINGSVIITEDGKLHAVDAEFSGIITASTININDHFMVDENGIVTAIDGNFSGIITSASGNIGGWEISNSGLTSYTTGVSLNLYNSSNKAMQLSYNGLHLFNHYSGSNEYLGSAIAVYNSSNGTNGMALAHSADAEYLGIGYIDSTYPYSGATVYMDMLYTRNGYGSNAAGFNFNKNVYVKNPYDASSITSITYTGVSTTDMTCTRINGYIPITSYNIGSQSVAYASSAGSLSSSLYTNQIIAANTGYGNLDFQGFDNAAGVNWVQANFEPLSSSDVRLKYDFKSFDNIPSELFYSLKPKQFRYKKNSMKHGIGFGLIAQQVESAFKSFGLDPSDYNLIEIKDVKPYTDDGYYVKDETHLINYSNLFGWMVDIIQKQNQRIILLENKL